jgi:LPXTG-motif cell wall-anchored protein
VKLSQVIVAAGICGASFVGFGEVAQAAPTTGANAVTCVTLDGLTDGSIVVPAELSDVEASVGASIACDTSSCAEGVLATVVDDSGVEHQACVASAVEAPVVAPARSNVLARTELPATGKGTGGLIIAALLVGSGSVASLLSRRKADRP